MPVKPTIEILAKKTLRTEAQIRLFSYLTQYLTRVNDQQQDGYHRHLGRFRSARSQRLYPPG